MAACGIFILASESFLAASTWTALAVIRGPRTTVCRHSRYPACRILVPQPRDPISQPLHCKADSGFTGPPGKSQYNEDLSKIPKWRSVQKYVYIVFSSFFAPASTISHFCPHHTAPGASFHLEPSESWIHGDSLQPVVLPVLLRCCMTKDKLVDLSHTFFV